MSRSVPEWIGASDDAAAPARVRLRVFTRCEGRCHRCNRKIGPADKWTLEHLIALILGGQNRESNLGITCDWCLPIKNGEDQAAKSKLARIEKRHRGLKATTRGFRKLPPGYRWDWSRGWAVPA
jgi:5-methylcytosine-specific restriction endonuclease McrA